MEEQQPKNPMYVAASSMESGKTKRRLWVLIALVVAIVTAGVVYFLTRDTERVDADAPVTTVVINENGFTPTTIKIKRGQELAWVNQDASRAHEVTADQEDAPGLDSTGPLAEGDTYIYEFEEAGTINYYDPLNPAQYKGTVIVE
jgi:plastocyanin